MPTDAKRLDDLLKSKMEPDEYAETSFIDFPETLWSAVLSKVATSGNINCLCVSSFEIKNVESMSAAEIEVIVEKELAYLRGEASSFINRPKDITTEILPGKIVFPEPKKET